MQGDARHTTDHGAATAAPRLRRAGALATAPLAIGLLIAGCGGGSPTAGVAHLGSSTATTSSTSAGSQAPGDSANPGSQAVAYAACMRSHGVSNFPDPQVSTSGAEVSVKIAVPAGGVGGNPNFKPAQQACRKLLPGGGPGSSDAPLDAHEQAQYLKAAACVRSHGVPNFPDPTFSGGGVHLDQHGIDQRSPTFKAAVEACKSLIAGLRDGGS